MHGRYCRERRHSMPTVISDYTHKKLVEYLRPGMRVLIKFNDHGIGDMIMFQPLYQRLKLLYPAVEFHLEPNKDQLYFAETPDAPVDLMFYITFRETAGRALEAHEHPRSKAQYCADMELGIPFDPGLYFTRKHGPLLTPLPIEDNCIGVVFQVQSSPKKGLESGKAKLIWDYVKAVGFTPIEVCFNNPNHNPMNKRAAFLDYSCRDFEASEENMFSVIQQCRGFIGVNTGTFCAATCILDAHVLHLYTGKYHFSPWYKRYNPVPEMSCLGVGNFDWAALDTYLKSCH